MAHSLHDHAGAPPASTAPSCSSWAATSSTDHLHMQAPPPPSNFFRQLFSNECDADEGGYEDLLQLPPPDVSPFEMLSSPKVLHPQHMENVDNSSQSQNRAGDFVDMPSTAGEDFPLDCYLKNNNGSSNGSQDGTTALPSNRPHTLEFVTPPGSVSSCSSILTFHSNTTGKLPDMTASAQMLLQDQTSPSENSYPFDSPSEPPSSADAHIKKSTEEHQTSLVSNKKVKTAQRSEQSCGAATESTKVQAAVSKVSFCKPSLTVWIWKVQSSRSKEKLGERISALQQLVSPFGKTDTASVLSEAIGYIKFLQEQVQVLSSPYMKPSMLSSSHQDVGRESMSDLRSRGLCLVPVSCTISVANNHNFNIGADYWASTPSGTIRAAVGGGGGGATSSATARHSPIS